MVSLIVFYEEIHAYLTELIMVPQNPELDTYFFNNAVNITDRRRFAVPDYAIDKHTSRGNASKQLNNDAVLLNEAHKRGIDLTDWSLEERSKSHGPCRHFAKEFRTQQKQPSPFSYFFDVGAIVTNCRADPIGSDLYHDRIRQVLLDLELTNPSSHFRLSDWVKTTWSKVEADLKINQGDLGTATSASSSAPSNLEKFLKPRSTLVLPQPKHDLTLIIPSTLSTLTTLSTEALQGLTEPVIQEIIVLHQLCKNYKDPTDKIYNTATGRCVDIKGQIGRKIVAKIKAKLT